MLPRIWLGPVLPVTRLSATHDALPCWSKVNVVCAPTLKLFHSRMACAAVCRMPTLVRPLLTDCVGALAPCQVPPGAICNPPAPRPFGTLTCGNEFERCVAAAAARAAACTACIDCNARDSALWLCLASCC